MGKVLACLGVFVALAVAGCSDLSGEASSRASTVGAATPSATLDPSAASPSAAANVEPTPGSPGAAPLGPTEVAVVLSITDGDTIRVDRGHGSERLRYIGVNTPEVGDPGGAEATAANAGLVEGREIVLERDVSETDQFDRLLRYVWIQNGSTWTFVNLRLVELGVAQAATYPPDVRYVDLLLTAEQVARTSGVGLWAEPPEPAATADPGGGDCHPSYSPCLPIVGDLDCADVRALGLAPVRVRGPDEYRLDGDHDGVGCE